MLLVVADAGLECAGEGATGVLAAAVVMWVWVLERRGETTKADTGRAVRALLGRIS
jgi:uncharacterized protein (TIGR03382 family)